ncbi:MAG: HAMP domain-containing protein [Desulfohalobiaceae bacterium]|mgnify:CR=1 FL=1|nr:HAMP domain-containing protein [Desulfohalobiaceae bacterium]
MKISHKIILGYLVVAFLTSVTAFLAVHSYYRVQGRVTRLYDTAFAEFQTTNELFRQLNEYERMVSNQVMQDTPFIRQSIADKDLQPIRDNLKTLSNFLGSDLQKDPPEELHSTGLQQERSDPNSPGVHKDYLKKQLQYHYLYLWRYFQLLKQNDQEAYAFFQKRVDPHYKHALFPVMNAMLSQYHSDVRFDIHHLLAQLPDTKGFILLSTCVTLLSITIFGVWTSSRVSRPINALRDAAIRIGQGQFNNPLPVRSRDEIGVLTATFQGMEGKLKEQTAELVRINTHLHEEMEKQKATEKHLYEARDRLQVLSNHMLRAQEKERRRIAFELHDDLGQNLSLLKLQCAAMFRKIDPQCSGFDEAYATVRKQIDHIIENVRRISYNLRPATLDDLGLSASLAGLVKDILEPNAIVCELSIDFNDTCFSSEEQMLLYRIVQEAFFNIAKHSKADQVSVHIMQDSEAVRVCIEDNGIGFDYGQEHGRSSLKKNLGLSAMQERALMVGGLLHINTGPGQGTRVSIEIQGKGEGHAEMPSRACR